MFYTIFSIVDILMSIIGILFCVYAFSFWYKNKENIRFFVSLKDILSQIDNKEWESRAGKGKENCKDSIILAVSYGIKESKSNIKKVLESLNNPAELEGRKMFSSHNFLILILIFLSISIIRLASNLGYDLASINIFGVDLNIIDKMLKKSISICITFGFMVYLWPKIKEMKKVFGKK